MAPIACQTNHAECTRKITTHIEGWLKNIRPHKQCMLISQKYIIVKIRRYNTQHDIHYPVMKYLGDIYYSTTVIAKIRGMPRSLFYDIPCYVTIDYKISPFDTIWRNPCIWSSKLCQLHVDFTFQLWCWPCIFRISMQEINLGVALLFQVNPPPLLIRIGNQRY